MERFIENLKLFSLTIFCMATLAIPAMAQVQWAPNGAPVCTDPGNQFTPAIVSDGAGGAFITWPDDRAVDNYNIYAQHLLASGVADPTWPVNGAAVCTASGQQNSPQLIPDGSGGIFIVWDDTRTGNQE